jgi:hypothetical protein
MVVHWGGAAADVKKIKALTGLDIIEDCAHAFGSYYELPATQTKVQRLVTRELLLLFLSGDKAPYHG